jgi:hypothetical protein
VNALIPSERGAYCACEHCGHKWQQDGLHVSWRTSRSDNPRRRSSDPIDAKQSPVDDAEQATDGRIPCSRCGQIDEMHQRRMQQLLERVRRLEAENALLRDSSRCFGELAERLNRQLRRARGSERED